MKNDTPSALDGLAVFCLALAWTGFGGRLLGPGFGPWAVPLFTLGLALIPVAACAALRFDFKRAFSVSLATPARFAAGLILAFGLLIASVVASVLIARFFPNLPVSEKALSNDIFGASFSYLVATVAVLPSACEELLFRGFILTSFSGWKRPLAIVVTGVFFGFLHLEIAQLPMTALVGMALSWACLETGSILVPAAMHAFHNLALLAIVRYAPSLVPETPGRILVYAAVALAFIDAGVVLLRMASRGANKAVY